MKKTIVVAALLAAGASQAGTALVPRPAKMKETGGFVAPTSNISYSVDSAIPAEGYRLKVSKDGISIASSDAAGRFYAETTLRQLESTNGYPCVEIEDAPRFGYRGVHLDVSRHFFDKKAVMDFLDVMAYHKFNVFHWHLTDSQGWRLPVAKYPQLTAKGPAYTESDIREIVAHAAKLHITIVPEVDVPGHSGAAIRAFPAFRCEVSRKDKRVRNADCVFCLGSDDSIRFIKDVMDELCRLFPGKFIHIGGDEVSAPGWSECPKCRARMKALGISGQQAYQAWFTKEISDYLCRKGRRAVGWDEIVYEGSVPEGAVVMSWRGKEGAIAAAKAGCDAVMCPTSHCYFDYTQLLPGDSHAYFGSAKRGMATTLEEAYSYNPLEDIPPEAAHHVLGGQCNNWTERTAKVADLQWKLWPRGCAMAEVYWSSADVRDFADFSKRMAVHRERLLKMGVNCAPHATNETQTVEQGYELTAAGIATQSPDFVTLNEVSFSGSYDGGRNQAELIAAATGLTVAGYTPGNLDIQRMIDKAAERGGGTVRVPSGEWEVKPFVLKSNITLEFTEGVRILASTNIADYATSGECPVFIYADHATNIAIVGKGVIDGRGGAFKETAMLRGEDQPKTLPVLMRFSRCRDVRLEGFHYTNSGSWSCHLKNCDGVKVKGTSCFNFCNRMNDGLDIESCNVTVEGCTFDTDDDALCFKTESDKSFPVTNVVVRNCCMGSICNGIKFGTGSYNTFRDITIENCSLVRPGSAFRFDWRKSIPGVTNRLCGIAGLALEVVDGGRMENVTVRNLTVEGYQTPIFIRHHHRHEPKGGEEPYLRNILIENVRGTAESRIASSITGVPARERASARRPRNITLRNVSFIVPGGGTAADVAAKVPEKDGAYPESFMFNKMPLPAYGFYVRHADNIRFENVKVEAATPDMRPEFVFEDCERDEITSALKKRLLPESDKFLAYQMTLAEFSAADKSADDAWRSLKGREAYDARRQELRAKMAEAVGGIDFERTPLNAKVVERNARAGYRIEKVIFESCPGVYVTGLLYLPDETKFKPPYRGIVLLCGHAANGKGSAVYQRGCVMGALAGFAVFVCDPFGQGERSIGNGNDACSQHNRYGALAALLGQSMARLRIRDGMRAIDYLLSRDDVMKDGVGCMGNSGGGTMTAILGALDPRVVAACPSCYISSLRTVVPSTSGRNISQIGDAEQNVFGQLSFGLNHAGYVLMGANAVRLHCCRSDFFPIAGSRETYSVVQDVVRNCGLDAQRYGITEANGRHGWKESLRASSIQWMRRWLAGDETVPEIDVEAMRKLDIGFDCAKVDCGLAGAACNVTSHGRVDRLPGFKSVFDCLKEDLAAVEKNRGERVTSRIKESAVRRAGISPCDFRSEEVAPQQVLSDGITILFEVYTLADGRKTPAVTFLPEGKPTGHVLVVDDRSNRSIHRMRVTQTLAEGKAITVADLWCLGETGAMYRKAWQGSDTADEVPSLMLYMLGKSMVGLRAEQIIVLAEAQRRRMGLLTEIVAHGNASIAAAHAYAARQELFSDIHCRHPPKSWADSVRKEEFIPFANVVNGALLDYDWTDLQKAR